MSYDIFFVRRDPGQTFEDALQDVEDSYEGGDPGPLTDTDLEVWDALLERARDVLGTGVDVTDDGDETRELTDPGTGHRADVLPGRVRDPRARTTCRAATTWS